MRTEQELVGLARQAQKKAYVPYSRFRVGAALEAKDGTVYTGCNIENAAFSPTCCAERTAVFKAVSEGERQFARIAIVGGYAGKEAGLCPPCGVCRQVLREFCDPETFEVVLAGTDGIPRRFLLKELLPSGFGPDNLAEA